MIIDCEAVIGFDNAVKKDNFYREYNDNLQKIVEDFQKNDPKKWGTTNKIFGDELDLLAIGPDNQLLAIELKHGSSTSGIYWGPLQLSLYAHVFGKNLHSISDNIKKMVEQKIRLGLLPSEAEKRLPTGNFENCSAVLAVAEPNERSHCWEYLKVTLGAVLGINHDFKMDLAKIKSLEIPIFNLRALDTILAP